MEIGGLARPRSAMARGNIRHVDHDAGLAMDGSPVVVRFLTREHVPPKSIGGHRLVRTCKRCNDEGGHDADSHMRMEADVYDFAGGGLREIKAHLRTPSGRLPIRLSTSRDGGVRAFGIPRTTRPGTHKEINRGRHQSAINLRCTYQRTIAPHPSEVHAGREFYPRRQRSPESKQAEIRPCHRGMQPGEWAIMTLFRVLADLSTIAILDRLGRVSPAWVRQAAQTSA